MPIDPATTDRRAEYHDSTYIRDYKGSFSYIFCCEIPVHVRAEAGETNEAEHTLSNASAWLFKKKKNHKSSSETTLKHNGIEA